MKAILIEEINYETVEKISQATEPTMLLFNCNGGIVCASHAFIDVLKSCPERYVLVAANYVASSAFEVFFADHGCERRVYPSCVGLCHMASNHLERTMKGKLLTNSPAYNDNTSGILEWQLKTQTRIGFSKELTDRFMDGEDIYFNARQMQEFVDYITRPHEEELSMQASKKWEVES